MKMGVRRYDAPPPPTEEQDLRNTVIRWYNFPFIYYNKNGDLAPIPYGILKNYREFCNREENRSTGHEYILNIKTENLKDYIYD